MPSPNRLTVYSGSRRSGELERVLHTQLEIASIRAGKMIISQAIGELQPIKIRRGLFGMPLPPDRGTE